MIIKELSEKNLNEAMNLVVNIFDSKPDDFDAPQKWLPASLHPTSKRSKDLLKPSEVNYLKYYVAIDEKSKRIIGVTGIYTLSSDEKDSAWLAYYCVDKRYRKKGYGTKLLDYIMDLAREMNKDYIKLYTSYDLDTKNAMHIYKKKCFEITQIKEGPDKEELVFMAAKL